MDVNVISATKQEFNGKAYYLCGAYFQHDGERLHRTVYEYHHGAIPKGYHVHHKDDNKTHNDDSNLELKVGGKHVSDHAKKPERIAYGRMHIERIRPLAAAWHGSDEGKAWHSKHGKDNMENRTEKEYTCTHCGKAFKTKRRYGKDEYTFCSNNCKSAYRRILGVDDEWRTCGFCGRPYRVNKYSRNKTCSRECAIKLRFGNESKVNNLCRQN